jgi:two-component system, chemotaxis family, sensor kinase CheA
LIFLPGFSTASAVSDISGRGVGMDVVRRSIQALGGRISIHSRPGHGSTFVMSLPLTSPCSTAWW